MRRSFSYTLLITWVLVLFSCKTHYVQKSYNTQNISVDKTTIVTDSQLINIYIPYKNILDEDMQRVISESKIEMTKGKPESSLTNFLADLLLEEGISEALESNISITPSISYFNYGGIRTYLPKGKITVGKIFELMPFENEMVFLELDGEQIQKFLDFVAAKGGDSVGGARFVISNKKAKNITVKGEKLNPKSKYWVVTNDYVASGGDGLEVFAQHLNYMSSGKKIRDKIIAYMEKQQDSGTPLFVELDGRISNE